MGFFFFVLFPAGITAMAPVSYVHFERTNASITAESKTCLLFVVPYHSHRLEGVTSVSDRLRGGTWSKQRDSSGKTRNVESESEAFLKIQGNEESFEVSVSPASVKSKLKFVENFIADESAVSLDLFCVSNWKIAVFVGGAVTSLTVLYVFGVAVLMCQGIFRGLYRLVRIAPNEST